MRKWLICARGSLTLEDATALLQRHGRLGTPVSLKALPGGLSNSNYKLVTSTVRPRPPAPFHPRAPSAPADTERNRPHRARIC
jgi:hypothetical protein